MPCTDTQIYLVSRSINSKIVQKTKIHIRAKQIQTFKELFETYISAYLGLSDTTNLVHLSQEEVDIPMIVCFVLRLHSYHIKRKWIKRW